MDANETKAVLSLCLLASFADREKHARERDEINVWPKDFRQATLRICLRCTRTW